MIVTHGSRDPHNSKEKPIQLRTFLLIFQKLRFPTYIMPAFKMKLIFIIRFEYLRNYLRLTELNVFAMYLRWVLYCILLYSIY